MKFKGWVSCKECGDGSFDVTIHNSHQEALEQLECTEEEVNKGNSYDPGYIQPIQLSFEVSPVGTLTLLEKVYLNIE